MKNTLFTYCFLSLLTSNIVIAQDTADSISLTELEIPNAPGFILMDNAPTLLERPNSSKAFALSILNAIDQNNGIPTNYAIEATPFWYFKHPKMNSYKYIGYNTENGKQLPFAQLKKIALNVSYKGNQDTIAITPNHNFAFGFRTNIFSIRSPKNIAAIKKATDLIIENFKSTDDKLIEAGITFPTPIDTTLEYKTKLTEYYEARAKFITNQPFYNKENTKQKLKQLLEQKPVFALDLASGYSGAFIDNSFSKNTFGRFGTWTTASFSQQLTPNKNTANYINIYALARYLINGTTTIDPKQTTSFDTGGKLELEFEKISIAYEYIYRFNDLGESHRSNGILKFKASKNMFLTTAFGKNFGTTNDLISMLGLNWGIATGNEKAMVK